jgi:hypothetical protein
MSKKIFLILSFFSLTTTFSFSSDWILEQKVLFQFEEMLYSNWVGTGFNYVSGSARYVGSYNRTSDDSTFKFINNVDGSFGMGYNTTDNWKVMEDKINLNSSVNKKIFTSFNFNGTADLKTHFDLSSAYLLGALGASFIEDNFSVQDNPITVRASFITNTENSFEFGNYFKLLYKTLLDSNITMTIKLENFYRYGQIFWKESFWNLETMTSFQINKLISSHIIVNALFDIKQSKKLQAWEKITIGFTWKL